MSHTTISVSLDKNFLKKLDERVQELSIKRSEYLRGLVIKDLEKVK